MTEAAVILAAVGKRYGSQVAVDAVDLVLRPSERVALVGHNGAGKSTLIKLMLGLVRPSSGRIEVLGEDPARGAASRMRSEIGYLPENVVFQSSMTGAELLAFYARLKRQQLARNPTILERVGIAHAANRRVGTYSKGMRQRLGLAQALIGDPKILLLDEPTTGLDPAFREIFYEIVAEMCARGAAVLISSHALAEIEGQTDRVVVMNEGRKVADGTMSELRRLAQSPVRIRLTLAVDAAPKLSFGNTADWESVGNGVVEVRCREADKMDVLRRLPALAPGIDDIEIIPPSLDEIYAHFRRREAAE